MWRLKRFRRRFLFLHKRRENKNKWRIFSMYKKKWYFLWFQKSNVNIIINNTNIIYNLYNNDPNNIWFNINRNSQWWIRSKSKKNSRINRNEFSNKWRRLWWRRKCKSKANKSNVYWIKSKKYSWWNFYAKFIPIKSNLLFF